MGWIFKDEPATPPDAKAERTRVILLALPFALLGLAALVMFVHDLFGGIPKQRAITILSFIAACIGFVALIFGINAKKLALKTATLKSSAPETSEKPWLKRKDWAAGRITSGARKSVIFLWIFVIFWLAFSTVITFLIVLAGMASRQSRGAYRPDFPRGRPGRAGFCRQHHAGLAAVWPVLF